MSALSPYEILGMPLVTERATALADSDAGVPQYVFRIRPTVNKIQLKQAIEAVYNVKVVSVNTILVKGKMKRQGAHAGKKADWKKAFVTLQKGQTLEVI